MKNLSTKICLISISLLGSAGSVLASNLPACPSSGAFDNCFGTWTHANGNKYVGEWRDGGCLYRSLALSWRFKTNTDWNCEVGAEINLFSKVHQ